MDIEKITEDLNQEYKKIEYVWEELVDIKFVTEIKDLSCVRGLKFGLNQDNFTDLSEYINVIRTAHDSIFANLLFGANKEYIKILKNKTFINRFKCGVTKGEEDIEMKIQPVIDHMITYSEEVDIKDSSPTAVITCDEGDTFEAFKKIHKKLKLKHIVLPRAIMKSDTAWYLVNLKGGKPFKLFRTDSLATSYTEYFGSYIFDISEYFDLRYDESNWFRIVIGNI